MNWTRLDDALLDPLVRFLGPHEASCVPFTEQLIDDGHLQVPRAREYQVAVRRKRDGSINGAILQSLAGVFHPVLDPVYPTIEAEAIRLLTRTSRRLYSIMGRTEHVEALERALRRAPQEYLTYHLMVQSEPLPDTPLPRIPKRMKIRQAGTDEHRRLFDIQKQYEIEEVLLPGSTFSPNTTVQHLKRTLAEQYVLVAEVDGVPIGKANTNARGLFYDQIGGVFTAPAYRSRGVGSALMIRLLDHIGKQRKNGSLFVKKHNEAALRMYRNIGFSLDGEFKISYFR